MRVLLVCVALGLLVVSACGGPPSSTGEGSVGSSGQGSPGLPALPPSPRAAKVSKVLVVVEENHSLDEMRSQMPYLYRLAQRFGYATDYHAVTHPSLPNYIAIAAGTTYGITDDDPPSAHPLAGASVFGQAIAQGRTAGVYADAMPAPCFTDAAGSYAVKHNPWAYFVSERTECRKHDVPLRALGPAVRAGRLPDVGMVVPDVCHDAHDCSLSTADTWLAGLMTRVFAGPDWRSGHLAVVVTADEDDYSQDNRVLTVVIHPSQRHHVVATRLDHYSLTRLLEDVAHAPYLANARSAPSLSRAFGLPVG